MSRAARRRNLSEDPQIALRQMAAELAEGSIVTQALSRYLYQILEFVVDEYVRPKNAEIARLKARIAELEK